MIEPTVEVAGEQRGIATISPETWLWWVRRQPRSSLSTEPSVTPQGCSALVAARDAELAAPMAPRERVVDDGLS